MASITVVFLKAWQCVYLAWVLRVLFLSSFSCIFREGKSLLVYSSREDNLNFPAFFASSSVQVVRGGLREGLRRGEERVGELGRVRQRALRLRPSPEIHINSHLVGIQYQPFINHKWAMGHFQSFYNRTNIKIEFRGCVILCPDLVTQLNICW